ncbi:MAG: hypothetical protein HPY85_03410 [Anaerolineae bacterium]|nr:hypothetical protein [Anaerolineae bacterium]
MSNNNVSNAVYRPDKITLIAVLSLLNGIINVFWGIGVTIAASVTIIGLCCLPITILPIILGGFEIAYAAKLLSNPPRPCKPDQTIAILDIACILYGNFISLVVGILLLVFYHDIEVVDWFSHICLEPQTHPADTAPAE